MIRYNVTFHLISKSTQSKVFLILGTLPVFSCYISLGEEKKNNLKIEQLMCSYEGLKAAVLNLGWIF